MGWVEKFTTSLLSVSKQQKIHNSSRKMPELHRKQGGNNRENRTIRETGKEQHEFKRKTKRDCTVGSSGSGGGIRSWECWGHLHNTLPDQPGKVQRNQFSTMSLKMWFWVFVALFVSSMCSPLACLCSLTECWQMFSSTPTILTLSGICILAPALQLISILRLKLQSYFLQGHYSDPICAPALGSMPLTHVSIVT